MESMNNEMNNDYLDTKIGYFNKDPSVATIYIGNLSFNFTELLIKDLFEQYGYVNYVKLVKDPETHQSRGIAFVQMSHQNHARSAIKALNGSSLDGRVLKVSIAKENNDDRSIVKPIKIRRKPYKAYVSKAQRVDN